MKAQEIQINKAMYTAHKTFGIGEITESNEKTITVYFEEIDQTKTLITSLVNTYITREEAEASLNIEMTAEEREECYITSKKEQEDFQKGLAANAWLREHNAEAAKKLMRNI